MEVRVIPEHFAKAVIDLSHEEKPLICLFSLLANYFEQKNRVAVTYSRDVLLKNVFLKGLEFRAHERNVEAGNVERSVFKSLLAMAEVLTENTLRSVVNGFVDWAEQGLKPSASNGERSRLITLYSFANSFYDSFNTLALPYFGRLVEMSAKILNACNATILSDSSLLLINGKKGTIEELEADMLIVHVIGFISNCARHREFFTQ
ncbi:BP28CT domain protein [Teladorsagia circumcincta]|uniref:HEAT repeat-containing protein 1 n=1 Tax=Teladorsagia circumcincta TaxID=45464 RepID=A0A2G9TV43_TELCI|nr:BP28CT domain protein [Teladorsagia circumcincta]